MTLATVQGKQPRCCHAFYTLVGNALIFTSDPNTEHISQAKNNPQVAVSIVLESKIIGKLQGVQITGELGEGSGADKTQFLKKFPYAVANLQKIWRIEIHTATLTDNTLGFGAKLYYPTKTQ